MRLMLIDFISLDGVVQAPGGKGEDDDGGFAHGGWSMRYFDDAMGEAIDEVMQETEALLYGRRTWQVMAGAWPERAGDPFADKMNATTKYVASRTLSQEDLTWNNSHLLPPDDAIGGVRKLKAEEGGVIHMWGSSNFARQLVSADVVDEYCLMIEPVVLGGGKRLFPDDGAMRDLELVSSSVSGTGVHICRYRTKR